jgi:hypothetical protein
VTAYTSVQLRTRLLEIADDPSWAGAHRVMAKGAVTGVDLIAIQPSDLSDDAIKDALYDATVMRLGAGSDLLRGGR